VDVVCSAASKADGRSITRPIAAASVHAGKRQSKKQYNPAGMRVESGWQTTPHVTCATYLRLFATGRPRGKYRNGRRSSREAVSWHGRVSVCRYGHAIMLRCVLHARAESVHQQALPGSVPQRRGLHAMAWRIDHFWRLALHSGGSTSSVTARRTGVVAKASLAL
jgi:hypothetical protein